MIDLSTVPFIHLKVKSSYSPLEGAVRIKEIPKLCSKMPAVALTDTNNLFGVFDFSETCVKNGIQPIIGYELYLTHDPITYSVTILVKNEIGYNNLIKISSNYYLRRHRNMRMQDLYEYSKGLIIMVGGRNGLLHQVTYDTANKFLYDVKKQFGRDCYIDLSRPYFNKKQEDMLLSLASSNAIDIVATNEVAFAKSEEYEAHDALLCISQKKTVYDDDRTKSSKDRYFKSSDEMKDLFADLPTAITNTAVIARKCSFYPKKSKVSFPIYETGDKTAAEILSIISRKGLEDRLSKLKYEIDKDLYLQRLEAELPIIIREGFDSYFLIVSDFVVWARSQNIPVGPGRGSGVGSIVAWSTGITAVDPIKYGLLFERFINPHRVSLPDFDIDFCQDRRVEVIRYVIDKYGHDRVAQIITFGKLQARAVVRDVGRVLGFSYRYAERIAKLIPFNPNNPVDLQEAITSEPMLQKEIESDQNVAKLMKLSLQLEGLYRQVSIHAAGIVISREQLDETIPLYSEQEQNVTIANESLNIPVTQFDLKWIEYAGLVKFDFLGLKTLTVIQKALELIGDQQLDLDDINIEDKRVFDFLSRGLTKGIFQFESRGMREAICKMKPDSIDDLIALTSLFRPGPIDHLSHYIERKQDPSKVSYSHLVLEPILSSTYGIIVYQEQVMQISRAMAGYSLAQADTLRRIMGKKIREEMEEQKVRFLEGAKIMQIDQEIASSVFSEMEKFASYAFNKSHATAYSIISYQTAYLKTHHTLEFVTAHMIYDADKPESIMYYVSELKELAIKLIPPDVNRSEITFSMDKDDNSILCGLSNIKGVGTNVAEYVVEIRNSTGAFSSFEDFIGKIDTRKVNKKQLESLIIAGAFDSVSPNRKAIFNKVSSHVTKTSKIDLFGPADQENDSTEDWEDLEKAQFEFKMLGFYTTAHPAVIFDRYITGMQTYKISQLSELTHVRSIPILVSIKKVQYKISNKRTKYAFITVSDETGDIEIRVMHEQLQRHFDNLKPGAVMIINVSSHINESGLISVMMKEGITMNEAISKNIKSITFQVKELTEFENIKKTILGHGSTKLYLIIDELQISPVGEFDIDVEKIIKEPPATVLDYQFR